MNLTKTMFSIVFVFGTFQSAFALVELRGHLGGLANGPALQYNGSTVAQAPAVPAVGLDVIVTPPLFPVGLGLRYESIGIPEVGDATSSAELSGSLASLVVNKRFLDTVFWTGIIGTYALTGSATTRATINSVSVSEKVNLGNYSVGLEGGFAFLGFLVGVELGYQNLSFGSQAVSGSYSKLHVGFGI